MRVLVAGGGGFIGSHMVDRLLDQGDDVVVLDSFSTGRRSNLEHRLHHDRCQVVEADIVEQLPELGEFDVVVNLASPASPEDFASMPLDILQAGSVGNRRLLELAAENGARFLLASTSEVYGDPLIHPQPEDYWGNVDSIGPRSCYDEAKRFAEATTMAYARHSQVDSRIARIFNTYGERMVPNDGRVVNSFIVKALREEPLLVFGDGFQTRSFCHVLDQVSGLIALLEADYKLPVNIGNPEEITIVGLAELVIDVVGSSSVIERIPLPEQRSGDPGRRCPDIGLARSLLDWEPQVSLRDGVVAMTNYFRESEYLG